jgi:hypothetical protein
MAAASGPRTPDTRDRAFALWHQLWSDHAAGRPYNRRAWAALSEFLYERAAAAGHVRIPSGSCVVGSKVDRS